MEEKWNKNNVIQAILVAIPAICGIFLTICNFGWSDALFISYYWFIRTTALGAALMLY